MPCGSSTARRALASVLSRHAKSSELFRADFGDRYVVVRDYYSAHKDDVVIEDVTPYVSNLVAEDVAEGE
jgi:hypothetical protein